MSASASSPAILEARRIVAQQIGLRGFETLDPERQRAAYRELTAAQQVRFTEALSNYVRQHASLFTAQQMSVADAVVRNPLYGQPLADDAIRLGDFLDELGVEAAARGAQAWDRAWLIVGLAAVVAVAAAVLPGAIARARAS